MPDTSPSEPAATPSRTASTAVLVQSIAVRFAIFGLNAVTGIATARLLSPQGRGELAAISLWPVLIAGVTTVGIPSALVYHGRRHPEQLADITASALALAAITGAVGTLLVWPLLPVWLHQHPAWVIDAARLCLLGTVINSLVVTGRAAYEARGDFHASNMVQLSAPLLTIAALALLWATGLLTAATAGIAYVAIGVPVLVWMLARLDARGALATWRAATHWRPLLHYGVRSYGVDLFGILALYLDQALVVGLLPPEAMGIYAVALSLARIVNAVHGAVATMAFPRAVGLAPDQLAISIGRSARLAALASTGLGLAIVAAGPLLVPLMYGRAYDAANAVLPILVLQVVLAGAAQVLVQGLLAGGRPGAATVAQMTGLGLGVPLFLVLVPAYGVPGAALALLVSTVLRLAFTLACYPWCLGTAMPRAWVDRRDVADLAGRATAFWRTWPPAARLRAGEAE